MTGPADKLLVRFAKSLVPEPLKHRWREFRWPARWLGHLPGTSRLYGPARQWVRAPAYFQLHPGAMREVLPVQLMPAPAFKLCGPIPPRFFSRLCADIPAGFVLELPDARLVGPDGWIVGDRDSYLMDASFWAYPDTQMNLQDHYMLIPRRRRPVRRLPGRTLSLASDFAIGGFGHFLHDSLTRLLLVQRAGLDPRSFDWIYWPHLDTPAVKALVAAAGLAAEKILNWNSAHDLQCESLTASTFPGRPGHIAPAYAEFLRRQFAPAAARPRRKIYLSRQGFRRNFRNAAEVEAVLRRFGYETCLPHQDAGAFAKCAAASHVVAIEGANFFNAFACAAGTRALLILPDAGPTQPYTLTLGLSAGFEMFLITARSLDQPQVDPGTADVHLEPASLAAALAQMETT
jgi:capsular polysaccharide biosynthesis protein